MIKECAVCNEPVNQTEENTCEDCGKTFCEKHNTVGSRWDGKRRQEECLQGKCEDCAIDWQSGEADYLEYRYSDR